MHIKRITWVVLLVLLGMNACKKRDVRLRAEAIMDRANMAVLESKGVNTIISDSGVIRYRILAETWKIFDKADTPYWEFPDGIYLEQFNSAMKADATVEADYAYYNEPDQLWTLRGNVKAMNLQGEQFETPLLYWNQKDETVYSDSSIVITRATSIIMGVGFRSNQEMTKYTILNPKGVFPIEE
jgi:LPS export ABC transporter protein LptC